MVSQAEPHPPSSRDRLLAAAAREFAARGFDGAKVDRIAARARVNKAMLYYHFDSKAALYLEILRDLFRHAAATVAAAREAGGPPDVQLRRFIEAIAHDIVARPHFPSIWLREIAEGGRHLNDALVGDLARILETLVAILEDGRRQGIFRAASPFVVQIGIVAPLLFFAATGPVRERFGQRAPMPVGALADDAMVAHVQAMALAMLAVPAIRQPRRPERRRSRS